MIGIDISPESLKVVNLERAGEVFSVKQAGVAYLKTNRQASKAEVFSEQQKLLLQLKDSLQLKDNSPVSISLPSSAIFVRYLEILKSQKRKEDDFVRFEAKQQIPFPLEEVAWDYFYIQPKAGGNKQAVLMAIKNDLMEENLRLIESVKLKPKVINLGLINLLNMSFINISFKRNETGILVDIGSSSTGVMIHQKGNIWFRSFSSGSNAIAKDISDTLQIPYTQAEKIQAMGPGALEKSNPENAQKVKDVVISNLVKLAGEIERSIEFFKSEQSKKEGNDKGALENPKIILTGGFCSMGGVANFFSDRLAIPTSVLNIDRKFQVPGTIQIPVVGKEGEVDASTFPYHFGVAAGAALAGLGKDEYKINLMKHKAKKGAKNRSKALAGLLSSIFLIGAAVVFIFFLVLGNGVNKTRLEQVGEVTGKFDTFRKEVIQIESDQMKLKKEAAFFINYAAKRYLWLDLMNEITQIIPLNIWIEEWDSRLDLTGGGNDTLVLKGFMLSYNDFNEFIGNVKTLSFVEDLKPESIETEEGQFRFSLNITIKPDISMKAS